MKKILGLALVLFFSCIPVIAKDMRFIQVTDTLYSISDEKSVEELKNIVNDINHESGTQFVVFTGNNIAQPSRENLEGFLKEVKALKVPYYVVLGNKDVNRQKNFGKKDYIEILKKNIKTHKKIESPNYIFENDGVIFIVADGSKDVIPSSNGYYKADVISWLDSQLQLYKDKNVVIFQHFPLIPPAQKESRYTFKPEGYLKLLTKYPNVKAIFTGHFEVNNEQTVNGILHVSTKNAPAYRVVDMMDYDSKTPVFWSVIKVSE